MGSHKTYAERIGRWLIKPAVIQPGDSGLKKAARFVYMMGSPVVMGPGVLAGAALDKITTGAHMRDAARAMDNLPPNKVTPLHLMTGNPAPQPKPAPAPAKVAAPPVKQPVTPVKTNLPNVHKMNLKAHGLGTVVKYNKYSLAMSKLAVQKIFRPNSGHLQGFKIRHVSPGPHGVKMFHRH